MSNPSLRVALGSISIGLENATTIEDLKIIISDLVTAIDDCVCGDDAEGDE